jgi:general secretion pathway protein D
LTLIAQFVYGPFTNSPTCPPFLQVCEAMEQRKQQLHYLLPVVLLYFAAVDVQPSFAQTRRGSTTSQISTQTTVSQLNIPLRAEKMQTTLDKIAEAFASRNSLSALPDGRIQIQSAAEVATLEFQPQQNNLTVQGSPDFVQKLGRIVSVLRDASEGGPMRLVSLNPQGRASLVQAAVFQQDATIAQPGTSRTANSQIAGPPKFLGFRNIHLASAQQESTANTEDPQAGGQTKTPRGLPLQQFDGVQVEMLPEIDAIILRGRDQQLNDLAEIIKRLDEASREAKPEIEVLILEHINSESLGTLIQAAQKSVLSTRQGRVTATALNNPNAVLLVGWGEALTIAKELISKLDRPAQPNSSFDVIQIKHASATDIQKQLQSFYEKRGTLGTSIQSTVDTRTNSLIVHASPRDMQEIQTLIQRLDVPRGQAMQQARVFEIRHSLAADIAEKLEKAIVASTGSANAGSNMPIELLDRDGKTLATSGSLGVSRITVNDRNNTIIVSSAPENLALIEQLIDQLDTPGAVAKIKIFPIRNGDSTALVETLRALIPSQGPNSTGSAQLTSSPDETSLLPLRFTVDTRGNNIIAVGSEGDLKIVEALIVRLDESESMQRKSTVYQLKNAPSVDIALAINEFLRSKRQVENIAPGANNPFEQLEKEVVVVPEPVQNKLILSATPRYYDEISRLIEQLDQQPPQVMIQVLLAEIDLGNTHEFGMEMGLQSSVLFDRSLLGNLATRSSTTTTSTPAGVVTSTTQEIVAASNTPGFDFNNKPLGNSGSSTALANSRQVGGQGLSNFSVGRVNDTLGFGGLVLSASSENVSFLLRALQDSRRLEVLSRPQVLTLDNQKAFIQVGQRIPRISAANVSQFGFQTSVTLENVGLIIGVTPRISPEGTVVMEIDAEKSELRNEDEGIPISVAQDGSVIRSPILDTITAQATVSAADGETIILGGMISRSMRTNQRKVPWLGDLPVLKNLFRYELSQMQRTELMIIMTPHIVRSQGDMERLKQAEFSRMSWCEADVFDVHGDVHTMTTAMEQSLDATPWQVIYPDQDPRGKPLPPVQEASPMVPDQRSSLDVAPQSTTAQRNQPTQFSQPNRSNILPVSATSNVTQPNGRSQFDSGSTLPQVPTTAEYRGSTTGALSGGVQR